MFEHNAENKFIWNSLPLPRNYQKRNDFTKLWRQWPFYSQIKICLTS